MGDLKGKVAVVTGASKGIGAAIAKGLSAAGAAVVVNYSSSTEGADGVVADINETPAFRFCDFRRDDYLLIRQVNARPFEFLELSIRPDPAEKTEYEERQ